jgi:hypothetical protein
MRTETVAIGDKQYTIQEKKRKANAQWRLLFQAQFTEVADLIEGLPNTDLTPEAIGGLLNQIVTRVGGSVDMLAEMVFAYSPELNEDREAIEEEAYDSEIMSAFTAVLKLAYPFGSVVETLSGLAALGRTDKPKQQNSS